MDKPSPAPGGIPDLSKLDGDRLRALLVDLTEHRNICEYQVAQSKASKAPTYNGMTLAQHQANLDQRLSEIMVVNEALEQWVLRETTPMPPPHQPSQGGIMERINKEKGRQQQQTHLAKQKAIEESFKFHRRPISSSNGISMLPNRPAVEEDGDRLSLILHDMDQAFVPHHVASSAAKQPVREPARPAPAPVAASTPAVVPPQLRRRKVMTSTVKDDNGDEYQIIHTSE